MSTNGHTSDFEIDIAPKTLCPDPTDLANLQDDTNSSTACDDTTPVSPSSEIPQLDSKTLVALSSKLSSLNNKTLVSLLIELFQLDKNNDDSDLAAKNSPATTGTNGLFPLTTTAAELLQSPSEYKSEFDRKTLEGFIVSVKTTYDDGGVVGMLEMLKDQFGVIPLDDEDI